MEENDEQKGKKLQLTFSKTVLYPTIFQASCIVNHPDFIPTFSRLICLAQVNLLRTPLKNSKNHLFADKERGPNLVHRRKIKINFV
jgi:hypothetical protein